MRRKIIILLLVELLFKKSFSQNIDSLLYPILEKTNLYTLINNKGEIVKGPFELIKGECYFNDCYQTFGENNLRTYNQYLNYKKNNKIGVIETSNGNILIPAKYDSIIPFYNDYHFIAIANIENKFGLLNSKNEWVIEPQFDQIKYATTSSIDLLPYFFVLKNSIWKLANSKGIVNTVEFNLLPNKIGYSNLWETEINSVKCLYNIENKKLLCDTNFVIFHYRDQESFSCLAITNSDEYVLINNSNEIVFPASKGIRSILYKGSLAETYCNEDKKGLINAQKKIILQCIYNNISEVNNYILIEKENKFGLIDTTGQVILPCKFEEINFAANSNDLIIVKKNNLYGLYNSSGKLKLPIKYNEINNTVINNKLCVKKKNLWAIINSNGEEIIKPSYESIQLDSLAFIAKKENKVYLVNFKKSLNPILLDAKSAQFEAEKTGNLFIYKQNKVGLINNEGITIFPVEYTEIETKLTDIYSSKKEANNYVYTITKDNKKSLYSKSYQKTTTIDYDIINYFKNEKTQALNNNKNVVLLANGSEIKAIDNNDETDEYFIFSDSLTIIKRQNKYGIINNKGNYITAIKYNSIENLKTTFDDNREMAFAFVGAKKTILNKYGHELINPTDEILVNNYINGLAAISINGYIVAYLNKKGEIIWKENKKTLQEYYGLKETCIYSNIEVINVNNENYSDYSKETILPCYYELKNLKRLTLNKVNIDSISPKIKNWNQLNYLNFASKTLNYLPEEFYTLTKLDSLLWETPINLSEKTNQFKNLKFLQISSPINQNPILPVLPNLTELVYVGDTMPKTIDEYKNLKALTFTDKNPTAYHGFDSNEITVDSLEKTEYVLPKSLYSLTNLNRLSLKSYSIDTLLPLISNLKNLNYLYISNTKIKYLPKEIIQLNNLDTLIVDMDLNIDSTLVLNAVKHYSSIGYSHPILPNANYIQIQKDYLPQTIILSKKLEHIKFILNDKNVDPDMGWYEPVNYWNNFFNTIEQLPNLKTLTLFLAHNSQENLFTMLEKNKDSILKCKQLQKIILESYTSFYSESDYTTTWTNGENSIIVEIKILKY